MAPGLSGPPTDGTGVPRQVAPVPMLLTLLQEGLSSQLAWRVQKDLPRLRSILFSAWLQLQSRRGPLIPFYLFIEGLAQQFDPLCFEVMTYDKRLIVEALASTAPLPESNLMVAESMTSLNSGRRLGGGLPSRARPR